MKKLTCALLSVILFAGFLCIGAAAADNDSPEAYAKSFSAKYEIIVDSWDYTEYEADINGQVHALEAKTVQADRPYTVGPLETTIYQLENGKYWLNQLYQHRYDPFANPAFTGFQADHLIYNLSRSNNDMYSYMYNTGLADTASFMVRDGNDEILVPSVRIVSSDGNSGNYGSAFQVSALPAEVRFTVSATDDIPGTYIGVPGTLPKIIDDYSFVFRGVIRFTDVKEIKPPAPLTWGQRLASWLHWLLRVFASGWAWMRAV